MTDSISEFITAYEDLYGSEKKKNCFRKDQLPDPLKYYRTHLKLLRIHNGWANTKCPFHEDKIPSLSVNLKNGGYFCHGCKAKGGDVIDFHQSLFDMDFSTAAKALGAWDDG